MKEAKQKMTFSIIIPVYNTEKYLEDCIESVRKQSYANYEIILIDDGSTDRSAQICDTYMHSDDRIRVIHKKNQGVSAARNIGIQAAKGCYIIFLDSDDYWGDKYCLEKIADIIQKRNSDIVVFQACLFKENGDYRYKTNNIQYMDENKTYSGENYLKEVLNHKEIYEWFSVIYAFKKKLWIENGFEFNPKIYSFEDAEILYKIILQAEIVSVLPSPIYYYRVGREGTLTNKSGKLLKTILEVAKINIDTTNQMKIDSKTKELLLNNFSHMYYMVCIMARLVAKEEQEEIFRYLKENKYMMKYTVHGKDLLLRGIISIIGIRLTTGLLFIRARWRERNGR